MEPNTGNNRTIIVSGITGTGNTVHHVDGINVTGARFTQGSNSSNLRHSVNAAGISGTRLNVKNVSGINVVGVDFTQPPLPSESPADSGPATGSVKEREVYKVKGKSYEVLNKLGEGGSCQVYHVYDPIKKETFALKIVDLECIQMEEEVVTSYKNEIELLMKLKECKHVVNLYEFEHLESEKKLLMLMEKGDPNLKIVLNPFVADENELKQHEPKAIKFYFNEMVKAVNEIHNIGVVHADLKPENFILINGIVKLIDFGISSVILENQTSVFRENPIGTFDYMAPETLTLRTGPVYKDKEKRKVIKYNCKTDIWSLGCILYDMASGHTPFQYCRNKMSAILNQNHKIDYSKIDDQQLVDCIKGCLQHDQTKRPTANELLQYPYLA